MDQQIQLGKYRLYHHLASGGMGEVFIARHEGPAGFSKNVVVKRILPGVASDPAFVTMFLNEARLAALIEHPNVVQIFDLGLEGTTYFIAMEYVHGCSLRQIRNELAARKSTMAPELAARICSQALQGLQHAHALADDEGKPLQIVHRDVSPDNLLIGFNGVVKVVDFGIASAAVNVSTTRVGAVKGKYAYMAPEQLTSQKLDGRADIYAVGVLLYELLAGQRPYHASSEPGLIRAILEDEVTPPRQSNPSAPPELDAVVLRAMARKPEDRYASAEEMSLALEAYIQSTGKTVTNAHIGALVKELFPEATHKAPVPTPPRSAHPVSYGLTPPRPVPTPTRPPAPPPEQSVLEASLPEVEIVVDERRAPVRFGVWAAATAAVAGLALLAGVALVKPSEEIGEPPREALQAAAPKPPPAATPALEPEAVVEAEEPEVDQKAEPVAETAEAAAKFAPAREEAEPEPAVKPRAAAPVAVAAVERKAQARPKPARKARATRPASAPVVAAIAAAASRPAPEPVATTGKVMLRVNPWAEVFWSGRSIGITPMAAVELPVGTHVLTLRNSDLNLERKVSVNVVGDREVVLKADLLD